MDAVPVFKASPIIRVLTTHQLNNPQNEAHTYHKPTATARAMIDASVSFGIEHIGHGGLGRSRH
jgi:hypothetical protein